MRRRLQSQTRLKPHVRPFTLYVVLPAWLGPGLLDWYCHRRTRIEEPENGGVQESLVHSLMFAEAGLPLLLSVAFEMNPLVIGLMSGAAVVHEVTAMADVRLALKSDREVSQSEQHLHSFLEVMPFWVIPLAVLLHEPATRSWRLARRRAVLTGRDLGVMAAAIAAFGVLPYSEELVRCLRHRRTNVGPEADPGANRIRRLAQPGRVSPPIGASTSPV